jgi:Glycosyl transferase family 11
MMRRICRKLLQCLVLLIFVCTLISVCCRLLLSRAQSGQLLVVLDPESACDGRRLGNQLFSLAALLYVAKRTNRTPILPDPALWKCMGSFESYFSPVDGVVTHRANFNGTVLHSTHCPCFRFRERHAMAFDESIDSLWNDAETMNIHTVLLCGYFQSWKYVEPIAHLVKRALTFRPEIRQMAERFIREEAMPPNMSSTSDVDRLVRVGVHVRRGDMAWSQVLIDRGYGPPGPEYYRRAMSYFAERYNRIQFIVFSDDYDWARTYVVAPANVTSLTQHDGRYSRDCCRLIVFPILDRKYVCISLPPAPFARIAQNSYCYFC